LQGLDRMIPEAGPSPMELLKRKGRQRQRASGSRVSDSSVEPWRWEDDT
jgi:hypothetical protein